MHCFAHHLYEMVERHGDISLYTMQGLEKLNDFTTQHYFNSTNKNDDFLFQFFKKEIEWN